MVLVKYSGSNLYTIGGYHGSNSYSFKPNTSLEVKDEDFWLFMKSKPFAHRVNNNILTVPRDFPLSKPKVIAVEEDEKEISEDSERAKKEPIKNVLRAISESTDLDYLYNILNTETREKALNAVAERIKQLEE